MLFRIKTTFNVTLKSAIAAKEYYFWQSAFRISASLFTKIKVMCESYSINVETYLLVQV